MPKDEVSLAKLCDKVYAQFQNGVRQFRSKLVCQWLSENWSTLYDCDDKSLAADVNVHRGTVGKWRRGESKMDLETIDLCQVVFEARAKERGVDPVAGALRFRQYEPDLGSLAAAGYMHALTELANRRPISHCQFQCFLAMAGDKDWRRAFELGQSDVLERIARQILGRLKGPDPLPRSVQDLCELYIAWRQPWDTVLSCINILIGNE